MFNYDKFFSHHHFFLAVIKSGYFTWLSSSLTHLLAKHEEVLRERPLLEFIHPDDRNKLENALVKLAHKSDVEIRVKNHEGSYLNTLWHLSYDKETLTHHLHLEKTTKIEESYLNLALNNQRLQELLDLTPWLFCLIDESNHAKNWTNGAWGKLLGWSEADVLKEDFYTKIFLDEKSIESFTYQLKVCDKKFQDYILKAKNNSEVEVSLAVAKLSTNELVILGQDISLRNEQARLIEEQEAQMVSSIRMSILAEMAGGVAHEINNPLSIINTRIHRLKRHISEGTIAKDEIIDSLTKVEQSGERIAKIVKSLRLFARDASHDPIEETTAQNLISSMLTFCNERFKNHKINLEIDIVQDFFIKCRTVQVAQVLVNLLNNSFDAVADKEGAWIKVKVESIGALAKFTITDSGKGINPMIAAKMMQPFYSTKGLGKGTGLGLSVAKGIVESHSGHLWYDLASVNTQFIFEIPLIPAQK